MSNLADSFAAELKKVFIEKGVKVSAAAMALQVSRQAVYNYLNAVSVPRKKVLARAVELWGIEIRVGNSTFGASSFESVEKPEIMPTQLTFYQLLDSIGEENLDVGVRRVGKTLRVSVAIRIPA